MPILCPNSTLWRLGKHARRGRRSKAIKSSKASRKVHTTGTLAQPFISKQADLSPMTMSPGTTGGVYMGPMKEEKSPPATTQQEEKLAEIRSPTQYYTDRTAIIGQGEDAIRDKESEMESDTQLAFTEQRTRGESRYNDTLNPDGANASIVFFEETFMSRFSHLSTSSPQCPRSLVASPKTSEPCGGTQAPSSPAKRSRKDVQESDTNVNASTELSALLTPSKPRHYSADGGQRRHKYVIPSWVRQRRYLPSIDEVDFDQIDLISLHSLTPPESHVSVTSLTKSRKQRKDFSPLGDGRPKIKGNALSSTGNQKMLPSDRDVPHVTQTNKGDVREKPESRSVLGDLTNAPGSPVKERTRSGGSSASYKVQKRPSVVERRARRNRKMASRRQQNSSRENSVDRVSEHNYVNVQYIARTKTDNAPRDCSTTDNGDDHDYVNIFSGSPTKNTATNKRPLHQDDVTSKGRQKELSVKLVSMKNDPLGSKMLGQTRRRRSEHIYRPTTNGSTWPDDPQLVNELVTGVEGSRKPASSIRRSLPTGSTSLTVREVRQNQNQNQPRKKLFGELSRRDSNNNRPFNDIEGAATLHAMGVDAADHESGTSTTTTPPSWSTGPDGKSDKSAYTSLSENDSLLVADGSLPRREQGAVYHVQETQETKRLIDKPFYMDNALRKARIVRTNSIEKKQSTIEPKNCYDREVNGVRKDRIFVPKKSSRVETRRSMPAPASAKEVPALMTPQRRSVTNMRTVETKLSRKQNRKIRRTVEGDEVMEAIVKQEEGNAAPVDQLMKCVDSKPRMNESHRGAELGDSSGREAAVRVQKIISDWNQSSERIVSVHGSTHYVGTHVHAIPDNALGKDERRHTQNYYQNKTTANPARVNWKKSTRVNQENTGMEQLVKPEEPGINEISEQVEVSHSANRRIPTMASDSNVTVNRRSALSSVIEIYIASQSYSPGEVDEIEAHEGEILVVNSSMQRENDWMWVYAPRSDRFGYFPAFAARPLEFQYSQV